ncbi:MAG: hypothetical protein J5932_00945 [Prevotella sp.]|nr:hypothetical protein [Prevotella sp.]
MSKQRIPESLTLRKARMISYSQMYAGERPSVESLVSGIPTDEAVEWCSYIVFRKDNLKIGECDLHILVPLLFSFESELQHKLTNYLGPSYNGIDMLIDRYSFLKLTSFLIAHHNEEHHELTNEEKTRLFKAYLVLCDEYLERISSGESIPDKYTSDDMLKCYMPIQLLTNAIDAFSDSSSEVIKGKWFFVDFANTDKKFKQYVEDFIKAKGYPNAIEYLGYIFNAIASARVNEPPTNIMMFGDSSGPWINFMNSMCANPKNFVEDDDLNALRSKPVYKIADNKFAILFSKFFVDKLFPGLLFDMASTLASIGTFDDIVVAYRSIKQQVGERFSEQYMLYRTLVNTLSRRMPVRICGQDLHKVVKSGEPDYYARRNNRVFVFEFKDVRLDSQTISSCDYETIRQKLYNTFVFNEEGKPKGVKQLAHVIEEKLHEILSKIDTAVPNGKLKIYPVLVYTDGSFDIEGINYYLNGEFRKVIGSVDDRFQVKDLVMVNLNLLMKLENYFRNGKIDLDKVVNEYLAFKESKDILNTVPFNKFLFQYARGKGFDMKFTKTFKDTFNELLRMEREGMIAE